MKRSEFVKNLALGSVSLFVVPTAFTSCEKEDPDPGNGDPDPGENSLLELDLGDPNYSSLTSEGGFVIESEVIVINTGDNYLALSSRCTHQGCTVSYNHGSSQLPCPCHGSSFSTSGAVLQGPALTPLTKYTVEQNGDILLIS